jgi:hypothetical protein
MIIEPGILFMFLWWGLLAYGVHYAWFRKKSPATTHPRMTMQLLCGGRVLEIGLSTPEEPTIITVPASSVVCIEHGPRNCVTVVTSGGLKFTGWMLHEDRQKICTLIWKE